MFDCDFFMWLNDRCYTMEEEKIVPPARDPRTFENNETGLGPLPIRMRRLYSLSSQLIRDIYDHVEWFVDPDDAAYLADQIARDSERTTCLVLNPSLLEGMLEATLARTIHTPIVAYLASHPPITGCFFFFKVTDGCDKEVRERHARFVRLLEYFHLIYHVFVISIFDELDMEYSKSFDVASDWKVYVNTAPKETPQFFPPGMVAASAKA
jgi:hypothetical protein